MVIGNAFKNGWEFDMQYPRLITIFLQMFFFHK